MRRHGGLFDQIVLHENLWRAWREFRRGKRSRPSVCAFEHVVDRSLLRLQRALTAGTWQPGTYRLLLLHEPKRRLIAAAPVRDRVVHHAVHRVAAPLLEPRLIGSTYACLKGRGSHRALMACLGALRRFRFRLSLDVRHYFLSIDRNILLEDLSRCIKDRRLLALLRSLADSGAGIYRKPGMAGFLGLEPGFPPEGCGLPIGNLTSQWWGNWYLNGFDHFVKRQLKIPHYQRYMDDLTLFADSRMQLQEARGAVADWLWENRRLRLKHPDARVHSSAVWWVYLGHDISRAGVRPTTAVMARLRRRICRRLLDKDETAVERTIASYRGVLFPMGIGL